MKKSVLFIACICSILLNAAEFSIGESKIKLPEMPGYINSADVHPELNAYLGRLVQAQYSVPASYILTSDAEIIKKSTNNIMPYVYVMLSAFIGTMLALLIFFYLTF